MIYEYAVDPGILSDWKIFRYLADGFGFGRGRIIARYPKDWPKLAYEAIEKLDDNAKKLFVTWLADRAKRAMTRARVNAVPYTFPTWFENAVAEHSRQPFRAIIADQMPSTNPPVLRFEEIDNSEILWAVSTQYVVGRNATEIGDRAAPLLAHASAIRFIDPYFKGDPDQVRILIACLENCVTLGKTSLSSIEIHVDGHQVKPATESYLLATVAKSWPAGLPSIRIVRWRPDYLHNRFILTDCAGIKFGDSLRQDSTRPDQMTLMEEDVRASWWDRHDSTKNSVMVCRPGEVV